MITNGKAVLALLGAATIALACVLASASAKGLTPYRWQNCTHVHMKYAHGIGKRLSRDRTRSGTNPVTNFYRSTRLYNIAMTYNRDLDRDRDGVACEQH